MYVVYIWFSHYEKKTQFDNPVLLAKEEIRNRAKKTQNETDAVDFSSSMYACDFRLK